MTTRISRIAFALAVALLVTGAPAIEAGSRTSRSSSRTSVTKKTTDVRVSRDHKTNIDIDHHRDIDIDVDVDRHYGCCYDHHHHPVAAVAAVAITAAVIGSMVYTLPTTCTVVYVDGFTYHHCGSTWYQPRFVGTSSTYVVVVAPQ